MRLLDSLPIGVIAIFCVTIGLAPFTPPHVWEKLVMLANGMLRAPIDIFDLAMHGLPWLVLIAKLARMAAKGVRG